MAPTTAALLHHAALFALILGRVGGLIATGPLFGLQSGPLRVRGLLAVMLALLLLPSQTASPVDAALDSPEFARMMAGEVLVGLLLGAGVMILLSGVQLAGQIISQMAGVSLGDVFNPAFDEAVSPFTDLFYFVTMGVFVAMGGHRMAIGALLDTFAWAPPGRVWLGDSFAEAVVTLLGQSFDLGLRAAGPALLALLLAHVVLGLVSRTLPQLNTVAVGFSLNAFVALAVTGLTVGAVAWTFQEPLAEGFEILAGAVHDASPAPAPAGGASPP